MTIRVYCTCRRPYDGTKMIKYVNCSEWFHPNAYVLLVGIYLSQEFLHEFWFNEFNTSLILSLIKISSVKIVQPLRYSQGNTQSIF